MTEPLDDARSMLEWLDRRGGLGLDVHERIRGILAALRAAPARCDAETTGPTAEDIRACARSTLIGFQHELGDSIDFICDQIARKATLPAVSSTDGNTP